MRYPELHKVNNRSLFQSIWVGYFLAMVLTVLITVGLRVIEPHLPMIKFPFLHILVVVWVAYVYGEGPAIVALVLSLSSFVYLFIFPGHLAFLLDTHNEKLAAFAAWAIGIALGAIITVAARTSRERVRLLAEELDRQKTLLESFMQHVPVGLGFHDRETRHLLVNRKLAELNQRTEEEILGKTVWEILPPGLAEDAARAIESVFATGRESVWRNMAIELGGKRYFFVEHLPVRSSSGEIIGVGVVVVETTEQVKARQELEYNYQREHRIAEALQSALLIAVPEKIGCLHFETLYKAAMDEARVGGDFYDVFEIDKGKVGIVIGDVSGKGLTAAVQVAMAKYTIRGLVHNKTSPAEVLEQVSSVLSRETDPDSFATIFFGILDYNTMTLKYSNAGHSPVMRWRAKDKDVEVLWPTGIIAGIMENSSYTNEEIKLKPGDELLLATDGLVEVQGPSGTITIENLQTIYKECKLSDICTAPDLVLRVLSSSGGLLKDDIAILRVRTNTVL